jgi:heat shock protein HslJ
VTFQENGVWTSSDGCNGTYGTWTIDTGGVLVTTAGASTLIGCDGAPTGSWVTNARRIAVSGNVLTLYDSAGRMVARLTR